MKKSISFTIVLLVAVSAWASTTMGHWRWRKDDGSETTATWIAGQQVAPTITNTTERIRLRLELYNEETDAVELGTLFLEYTADGGVTWDSITTYAGSKAFVLAGSSPYVTDNQPTTRQLTGLDGYFFQPGRVIVSSDYLEPNLIAIGGSTEYEWVIKPTANIKPNTTYVFDLYGNNYSELDPPTLLTAATLPIILDNFAVQQDGKRVKLVWTTESEQDNDYFMVERSADGKSNWVNIAKVKGSGTSAITHDYIAYDNLPLNGKNFFRIRQFDTDGKSRESEVRMINIIQEKSLLTIFPNPTRGDINLAMPVFNGTITLTLTDMQGRVVHRETFKANGFTVNYSLHMKAKPAPGMYILQASGENLKLSGNVIVQ